MRLFDMRPGTEDGGCRTFAASTINGLPVHLKSDLTFWSQLLQGSKSGCYKTQKSDSLLNRILAGEYANEILSRLNRTRQSPACLLQA